MSSVAPFNTIQYCIDNSIPSFTFPMTATKQCFIKWSEITKDNFQTFLKPSHNGFAILTGIKYIVLDLDSKHNPPGEIKAFLMENCKAIEQTPGGYHFWFLVDNRTSHFVSTTDAYWNNKKIKGLDIRSKGGIIYCAPSKYKNDDGEILHILPHIYNY